MRLVNIDRKTPMLMPPSIQDWVKEDDMAHFVLEAVNELSESDCHLNWRGTGSRQYPPQMMMALLIYCYAHGVFSSRRIEAATYRDVSVRFITGDTHPDHDVIAAFRRSNYELFVKCFVKVLELAKAMKILQVGEVALDGTVLEANASKKRSLRQKEMEEQSKALEKQIQELIERAEEADAQESTRGDGTRLPAELSQAQQRQKELKEAMARLREQKSNRAQEREKEREDFDDEGPGHKPKQLEREVQEQDTINLTDPDARLIPGKKGGFVAGYNAQIAVAADTSAPLIVATSVCDQSNDRKQLKPMGEKIMESQPQTRGILVDTGYDNSAQIFDLEQKHGVTVYCPPEKKKQEAKEPVRYTKARKRTQEFRKAMAACIKSEFGKTCRQLRATTVEPCFSWIKNTLGFTRFLLRGLPKVNLEWQLVCLACNVYHIHRLKIARKIA